MVPEHEAGTVLQDLVLKILFDYRMSPFNSGRVPMTLSSVAKAARVGAKTIGAVADSLAELSPPLVEILEFQGEPAYRLSGSGVVFVQNVPQGLASTL
jgi:hypothetical protein